MKTLHILIATLILASGCITKPGKKVTGIVPTGNGTWRLKSAVDREKAKKIEMESVKSKPVPTKTPEIKPTHAPPVSAVGKPTPFEPTVKEIKLSPAEVLIEDLKNVGKENSLNVTLPTTIDNEPEIAEPKVKVNWAQLILFYLCTMTNL